MAIFFLSGMDLRCKPPKFPLHDNYYRRTIPNSINKIYSGEIVVDEVIILSDLIITHLLKARDSLSVALAAPKNELNRDASIQRFEFTIELAWKTMRRILKYKSIFINSPRDTIREAAKEGLIQDPKAWFAYLENRNLTSNVYNEEVAEKIYNTLPGFKVSLDSFIDCILKL